MDRSLELGFNFFDTANVYGQSKGKGYTEDVIGRWFAQGDGRRDQVVLATKVYGQMGDGKNDRRLSARHIRRACEDSLRRLRTDHIDLYQCHRYDELTPLDETCWAMHDLITQGKVLYWGVSEWTAAQIEDAHGICRANGWHRPVSNQPVLNLLQRHWENECFPVCEKMAWAW